MFTPLGRGIKGHLQLCGIFFASSLAKLYLPDAKPEGGLGAVMGLKKTPLCRGI